MSMMSEQEYACYVDLLPCEEPDGCVFDEDRPEDCIEAMRLLEENKTKLDCTFWRPVEKKSNASQWQPIETAPKNTMILCYSPKYGIVGTAIYDGKYTEMYLPNREDCGTWRFTHWMPLPAPPEKDA